MESNILSLNKFYWSQMREIRKKTKQKSVTKQNETNHKMRNHVTKQIEKCI